MLGSAVEYTDTLPPQWEIDQLGNLGHFINGYAFKPSDWGSTGRPIIRIQNLNDSSKPFNYFAGEIDKKYLVLPGDILISWSASLDAYVWKHTEAWLNQHIFKALPDDSRLDRGFFFFVMKHAMRRIATHARGSTMRHVTAKQFKQSEIPIPPISEQRRIAALLSTVQRAIEQQERLIALTTELKKALMHKLFTEGMRGEKQKETEVGLMAESWEIKRLAELIKKTEHIDMRTESTRKIQYVDVSSISRQFLRIESTETYVLKDAPGRARKKIAYGDVIFATVRPTLLRVARVGHDYDGQVCSTAFCVLRDKNRKTCGRFIYYLVQREQFINLLAAVESGASYPAVTDRQVKAQLVPVPRDDEQLDIAKTLESCDANIAGHEQQRVTLQSLFRTLLHQLMTAQVRVNDLDLSELGYEPIAAGTEEDA
jgi:type I restriction enzyme S subunit